MKVNVTSFV